MGRYIVATIAVLAGFTSAALAADFPAQTTIVQAPGFVAPVYNWTGFYLGINGGGATSDSCWNRVGIAVGAEGCHAPSGGLAGAQIGANLLLGSFVLGVEGTGDWGWIERSNVSSLVPAITNRTKVKTLWSATGRAGYAWDAALFYVKGGAGLANDRYDSRVTLTGVTLGAVSVSRLGWTIGAGVEYGFVSNWTAGLEYNRFDFGSKTIALVGAPGLTEQISHTIDTFTARINYRFGPSSLDARY
jgi:outer membrane immunogenic protein